MKLTYVQRRYADFIQTHKYIPTGFSPYFSVEVEDIVPTLTTCCGNINDSGSVLILVDSLGKMLNNSVYSRNLIDFGGLIEY